MKSLHIGCWRSFKKKHKAEVVRWIEEEARARGIMLEDDTEIFYRSRHAGQKAIFFGKEAIDETIGHIANLRRCSARRIGAGEKNIFKTA